MINKSIAERHRSFSWGKSILLDGWMDFKIEWGIYRTMGVKQLRGRLSECSLCMRWHIQDPQAAFILHSGEAWHPRIPSMLEIYRRICAFIIDSHHDNYFVSGQCNDAYSRVNQCPLPFGGKSQPLSSLLSFMIQRRSCNQPFCCTDRVQPPVFCMRGPAELWC